MYEGSGLTIDLILQHQLAISEIVRCEIISYFPLPKELRNLMKGLIIKTKIMKALDDAYSDT